MWTTFTVKKINMHQNDTTMQLGQCFKTLDSCHTKKKIVLDSWCCRNKHWILGSREINIGIFTALESNIGMLITRINFLEPTMQSLFWNWLTLKHCWYCWCLQHCNSRISTHGAYCHENHIYSSSLWYLVKIQKNKSKEKIQTISKRTEAEL